MTRAWKVPARALERLGVVRESTGQLSVAVLAGKLQVDLAAGKVQNDLGQNVPLDWAAPSDLP